MELTLTIKSSCMVSVTIPDLLAVKREILLCSRCVNIPTLTYKTQLASILSITCNIQHLAQQQSQRKRQWSMLRKRTFRHSGRANMPNQQSSPLNDVIKWMKARAAWKQREFEPLGHCVACDPKISLWLRNDMKRTSESMKTKRNGLSIMLRQRPLWQGSELNMQR